MDPVSIVGVAAATLQFLDFACKLFTAGWKVYNDVNGRTAEMTSLSLVLEDLQRLKFAVDSAVAISGIQDAAIALQSFLAEVDDIETEIKLILPRTSKQFTKLSAPPSTKDAFLGDDVDSYPLSVGNRFHLALEQVTKMKEMEKMKERLRSLRKRVVPELIVLTLTEVRDTQQCQVQANSNLDSILSTLIKASEDINRIGPQVDLLVLQGNSAHKLVVPDPTSYNVAERQIVRRLWQSTWKLDENTLSVSQNLTNELRTNANIKIQETLFYKAIKQRENAISNTFQLTYEWIFSPTPLLGALKEKARQDFLNWLEASDEEDEQPPFWITGRPGAGKSVLMKFIANHSATNSSLLNWAGHSKLFKLSYFAWKPGVEMAKTGDGLMMAILYQACEQDPSLIGVVCPRHWALFHLISVQPERKFQDWTTATLRESLDLLVMAAETRGLKLSMFIDGLDEFVDPPLELCDLVMQLSKSPSIKICIASRPWQEFLDVFNQCPTIELHRLTAEDIGSYVLTKFEAVPAFAELNTSHENAGTEVVKKMLERSNGIFLWIALVTATVLESLILGASVDELQEIVESMPEKIEELYYAIFSSIPKSRRHHTAVLLRLYNAAIAPQAWFPIYLADVKIRHIDQEPPRLEDYPIHSRSKYLPLFKRRLSARTRGILEFIETTDVVECLHRTASEWLQIPHVLEILCEASPEDFQPEVSLYLASLMDVSRGLPRSLPDPDSKLWRQRGNPSRGINVTLHYIIHAEATAVDLMVDRWLWYLDQQPSQRATLMQTFYIACCALGLVRFVLCWYSKRPEDLLVALSAEQPDHTLLRNTVFRTYLNTDMEAARAVPDRDSLQLIKFLLQKVEHDKTLRNDVLSRLPRGDFGLEASYPKQVLVLLDEHRPRLRQSLQRLFHR